MILPISRRIIHLYKGELCDILKLFFQKKIIEGKYIKLFASKFSERIGVKYAIPTSSGRMALYAILKGLNFSSGSEVILSAYEDLSVPLTIKESGLFPIFCDINYETQNISFEEIKSRVTNKTVAIIVTHLFGNPCEIKKIAEFAEKYNIVIIEDCAHAIGTKIGNIHVGCFGRAAFFSFHTTKTFMCFGGGMAVTNNEQLRSNMQEIINKTPYPNLFDIIKRIIFGYFMYFVSTETIFSLATLPFLIICDLMKIEPLEIYDKRLRKLVSMKKKETRFTNVQALVGIKNLMLLDSNVAKRKINAAILDKFLNKDIGKPKLLPKSNFYFYIIFSDKREYYRRLLLRKGIDTGKCLMRNCAHFFNYSGEFTNTKKAVEKSIQIPIYEKLSQDKMFSIVEIINNIFSQSK